MLENVPISALAICYAPLALTIIGFIVFAWMTDADARRRYLRQLDMRTEDERPEMEPVEREKPLTAQTPGGSAVTIQPTAKPAAPAPKPQEPPPPAEE
jgi:hypothetical protein